MAAILPPEGGGNWSSSETSGSDGSGKDSLLSGADGNAGSDGGPSCSSTGTSQIARPVMTATRTMSARVRPGLQFPPLPLSLYSFAMQHLFSEFASPGGIIANLRPG
jgi:hypothetical protein